VGAIQDAPARRRRPAGGARPNAVQRSGDYAAGPPAPPAAAVPDPDIDVPPLRTMVGDDRARRALRAALFGCLAPVGVFTLYSVWELLGLMTYPGELSPAGHRNLRLALLVNGTLFAAAVLLCCGVAGRYD
jgi:hypothetical protein